MAETFYPIRSVKGYFQEFGVEAIGKKKMDRDLVRNQIIDSFKKEIFGQFMIHLGDPQLLAKDVSEMDEKTKTKANNILSNSIRKWKRLCIVFQQYRETANLIMPGDLMLDLEDVVKGILEGEPDDTVDGPPNEGADTPIE